MASASNSKDPGNDPRVPKSEQPGGKDYEEMLARLQKYLPFLNTTIARVESKKDEMSPEHVAKFTKLANVRQLLTSSTQTLKYEKLVQCEKILKKLADSLKFPIPADNPVPKPLVKTEPQEVSESPASPPQLDLNPPKSCPKIIPVERCAAVERDFSKVEEEPTLEASRNRLKGLMLKSEFKESKSSAPTSSHSIPGLDNEFPSKASVVYSRLSVDNIKPPEAETMNQSHSAPLPVSKEEWNRLGDISHKKTDLDIDWPSHRDVDERRHSRDHYRQSRRDIDERQMPVKEPQTIQKKPLISNPPLAVPSLLSLPLPPAQSSTGSTAPTRPSLLPRNMPTHNMGFTHGGSLFPSQEYQRSAESMHMEVSSQVISKTFISTSLSSISTVPPEQLERSNSQSRYPPLQREVYDRSSSRGLLPTPKTFPSSSSVEERRNISTVHSSSWSQSVQQAESKPSARERIMQRLDTVEKLGVSQGGALRKLKSDILDRSSKKPVEADPVHDEELSQKPAEVPRKVDPRLERDQRRTSVEDDALKLRLAPRPSDLPHGYPPPVLPHGIPGIPGSNSFGSAIPSSAQWNQSNVTPPPGRTSFQGQQGAANTFQWQATCPVKQTTAHDLGLRYQPKSRQGRFTHASQNERVLPSNTLKVSDDKHSGTKESESHKRDCDISQVSGRRLSDPRLSSGKSGEDKKSSDSRNLDTCSKKKEKSKDKEESDYSSPLGSIYSENKRNKTGQGYGLQKYKIPRRPKEQSPPREPSQNTKQASTDSRPSSNRDPRLSKSAPKISSGPETESESQVMAESTQISLAPVQDFSSSSQDDHSGSVIEDTRDGNSLCSMSQVSSTNTLMDKDNSKCHPETRSPSPKPRPVDSKGNLKGRSRSRSIERSPPHSGTRLKERSPRPKSTARSSSRSRGRSPSYRGRSRSTSRDGSKARSRSTSRCRVRDRSSSHSRGKSAVRSSSRSRARSRGSPLRARARSRGRSRSRSRAKSRGRSRSRSRAKSRGRSRSRSTAKSRGRSRSRSTAKSRARSSSRTRGKSRGRSSSRTRGRSRGRSSSRSRGRSKRSPSRSRDKSRGRSASRSKGRSTSRTRDRSRDRSTSRNRGRRSRSRVRDKSKDRSPSRSRARSSYRSPSYSRDRSSHAVCKARSRRSHSRSASRGRSGSSYSKEKSTGRLRHKSRARSNSSGSDRHFTLDSWKRTESPSPDRRSPIRRTGTQNKRRSISSGSDQSRDRQKDQSVSKRSLSEESVKDVQNSAASPRSSSSGRSSPLFPKEKSPSPSKELVFDNLLKKGVSEALESSDNSKNPLAVDTFKDTVVSSSVCSSIAENKSSSAGDVVVDVPTSTSGNIPEPSGKADVGSTSEVLTGGNVVNQQPSILAGLINLLGDTNLIELALAASHIPEEKRNKVLEIIKGEGESKNQKASEEKQKQDVSGCLNAPSTSTVTTSAVDSSLPNASSDIPKDSTYESKVSSNVSVSVPPRGGKKKKQVKGKVKRAQNPNAQKDEVSPEGMEKQRKKRNELEKLHEDIREMFICKEVITATGQRSCRMRKDGQDGLLPPKLRPNSADEKLKFSKGKQDEGIDFSDDSSTRQVLDTSTSDNQATEDASIQSRDSSGSDDDLPASKWMDTSGDSPDIAFKKKKRPNFLESESDSELLTVDEEVSKPGFFEPLHVLDKISRKSVSRRGRKSGTLARDQVKTEEVRTPSYDGDCDDGDPQVEDKDMSQIDTSNIIQVEGGRSKLTRNQLKLLKGPEPQQKTRPTNKRSLVALKDFSECESDTSKASESFSPSPIQKKKKKKISDQHRGVVKKKLLAENDDIVDETVGSVLSEESFDNSSFIELDISAPQESTCGDFQDKPNLSSTSEDIEMHEIPLIARMKNLSSSTQEPHTLGSKPDYHADLNYSLALTKASCKLCNFFGKTIVNHYVSCHPQEEVLISRLPQALAELVKADSTKYVGELQSLISKYSAKKRSSVPLQCLICKYIACTSLRLYEHVSTHTGEYRFSCTMCNHKGAQRQLMKSHRKMHHSDATIKDICNAYLPGGVASMKILFAYLCPECNYIQLSESSLKKHLKLYHSRAPSIQPLRINISEEAVGKIEANEGTALQVDENAPKVSHLCKPENISETSDNESPRNDLPQIVRQMPHESTGDEKPSSSGDQNAVHSELPSCQSSASAISPDMSIFVGSDQPCDDENQLLEERKKVLEDAGVKIRDRPKIRSSVSERLAKLLQSEQHNSDMEMDNDLASCEENALTQPVTADELNEMQPERNSLKSTPVRLSQKFSESAEKRLTRSTTRTPVVSSDCDSHPVSNDVPDEVKEPLSALTLHLTLQRMQETIQSPVSSANTSSVNSPPEIFPLPLKEFVLKKGQVRVGLVEAKALDDSQVALCVCLSPNCSFSTKQVSVFMRHIDEHPRKPTPAPCSNCGEGGNILRDLQSSFNHLMKYHLMEASHKDATSSSSLCPPAAMPMSSSSLMLPRKPTLIRPRKLPGDVLSAATQGAEGSVLPSLVISSVISLSKNHTPDGIPLPNESQGAVACSSKPSTKTAIHFRKDEASMNEMMRFEKICHLFKCLGQHCSFSTNSKAMFVLHYEKHLSRELQRNPDAPVEMYEWKKCVYCGDVKDSGIDLAAHISLKHGVLNYQCSGCFYRAASATSVAFHQKKSHNSNVMVFECRKIQSREEIRPKATPQNLEKVHLYKCLQGECGLTFVSANDFSTHQQSKHPSDKIFYCNECGLGLDSSSKLIWHYSTSHAYRKYHCLHCSKASETKEEIGCHMFLDHPDQDMVFAARVANNSETVVSREGNQIGLVNFGDQRPRVVIPKDHETDSDADPLYFDEDSSLPCITYDIHANSSWAHKSFIASSSPVLRDPVENHEVLQCLDMGSSTSKTTNSERTQENDQPNSNDIGVIGLSGSSLYLCGYSGCSYKAEALAALKDHLLSCGLANNASSLSCLHCQSLFRHPSTLIEHLPKHGIPRYICGFCNDFRTTHPKIATRHVKQKHKTSAVEMVLQNENDSDPDTAVYIVRPKENILKRGKAKIQSFANKTTYAPEERELLPNPAVFTRDVTCTVCQYSTKVRSNMMRHLEQHAMGSEPSSVPVLNPVPCLERNEKMFDTMTNHAISSTIPVRRDSNTFKVTDEPRFIPDNQRYICCAPTCSATTTDDTMLRHHIRVLHPEIVVYKCPHCPDGDGGKQAILLEKLGSHLKMHDSRLYSCLCCNYYHYQRYFVERHTAEKHPDQKYIKIIREPRLDGPSDVECVVDTESEITGAEGTYECALCSAKGMTKQEATAHAASVHRINTPYKCNLCSFRSSSRARFAPHFAKQHPYDKEEIIEVVQKSKVDKPIEDVPQLPPEPPTPPIEPLVFDSTPIWTRDAPRVRHLRGILFEEHGLKPKELETSEVSSVEAPTSVRLKRSLSSASSEDMQNSKREKRDSAVFTCARCLKKFPITNVANYRDHLSSHFSSDDSRYKCARCPKICAAYDDTVSHVSEVHQRIPTPSDVIDTHSKEYIDMDITRQTLESGLPSEAPVNRNFSLLRDSSSPSSHERMSATAKAVNVSPNITSPIGLKNTPPTGSKRLSPRNSGGTSSASLSAFVDESESPPKISSAVKNVCVSPPKGIRPLSRRSVLKSQRPHAEQHDLQSIVLPAPSDYKQGRVPAVSTINGSQLDQDVSLDNLEGDIEVDESALEEDIEEVEEIEEEKSATGNADENSSENLQYKTSLETDDRQNSLPPVADAALITNKIVPGVECKYKISHGCNYLSRTNQEASQHEKRHWEVQPWKCGYCSYQSVREYHIKIHSGKRHPGLSVSIIKNDLPAVPKIVVLSRSHGKSSPASAHKKTTTKEAPANERVPDNIPTMDLPDVDDVFKSVHVLRCGYCRLREDSLSRLFLHWQYSHKDDKKMYENVPDGRRVVPFKYREVKLGEHEKATMAFRCGLCSRSGTVNKLIEHYPTRHPGEKLKISELIIHDRVQCSLCPRQFSAKAALITHFSACHPGEQIGSTKVKTKDAPSDGLNMLMGCLYCLEPVKTALEMKDHHLNFHSHLDPKYIEMDTSEPELQPSEKANPEYSRVGVDSSEQSDVSKMICSRPSVIACVSRLSQKETSVVAELSSNDPCLTSQPMKQRAVAKKSTARVRAVARKSTGGKVRMKNRSPSPSSSSSEMGPESDIVYSPSSEDTLDESKIICPIMIGGTRMRVNLATLSQHSNISPKIVVKRLEF
ncbi:hypothetical protein ONE63_010679 [Megalurothrips usitatus]|uniref:C2H2-type domain-containing protein n=1 Tax=Megalurothrips usitatus TaxID=439358 RepID=A0AAV7XHT1_9NEOP|nr:hypothetical protein ONE63_010679 [Megalurothrips usitatus]KAJ1524152.1 hypothetical protein ONE63_010679 [Megalurothrips usitatus]